MARLALLLLALLPLAVSGLQCYNNVMDPTNRSPSLTFQDSTGNPYTFCQSFYMQAGVPSNVTFNGFVVAGSINAANLIDCMNEVVQQGGAVASELGTNFYQTYNGQCCQTDGCNAIDGASWALRPTSSGLLLVASLAMALLGSALF